MSSELSEVAALDQELVSVARHLRVLSALEWPANTQAEFLSSWSRGAPAMPEVTYGEPPSDDLLRRLEGIIERAVTFEHAPGKFVHDTALSYFQIAKMLRCRGTPEFSHHSILAYGRPGDPISGGRGKTSLDAARYFIRIADEFLQSHLAREGDYCVPARVVRAQIEQGIAEVFPASSIAVDLDPSLPSKAAAGATRIRLRDATCFSEYDANQLLQHEAFVHSLTALNGRRQPLQCMGLGAPRTTGTQEGLATFAELITGAIDVSRLDRIALRVIAIDLALSGADFIEVFRFFVEAGQPESESYNSTKRVFRGAPLTGGSAFTKDSVYLHGLLEVHTFFRKAMRDQQLVQGRLLFAGRMTLEDVNALYPWFVDGSLAPPEYLPPWFTRTTGLAGYLAFSVFANEISLDAIADDVIDSSSGSLAP